MADSQTIAFSRIAESALSNSEAICRRWLPDGRREGWEWVARNPKRADRRPGSFKVNLQTGKWGDFAAGVSGGDLISLGAYLSGLRQSKSAIAIADMLGIDRYA